RAWELLLGVLLAWKGLPALPRLWREGAAFLGLVLIIVAATCYSDWIPFPGYAALLPCLGAALIIGAGKSGDSQSGDSWTARALGTILLQGLPGRFSPEVLKVAAQMNYDSRSNNYFRAGACFLDRDDKLSALESNGCLRRDESKENYLLIGDSYAAHLW